MIPFVVAAVLAQASIAAPAPFHVGERLEYTGHYLIATGHASMSVLAIDSTRGAPTWHFAVGFVFSAPFYHDETTLESWTATGDFESLRFAKKVDEKDVNKNEDWQVFGDSGYYRSNSDTTHHATARHPLDDANFVYFLRTMTFREHTVDTIPRYYRESVNPVIVEVLGHEMVDTGAAGRFYCWVLHPIVNEPHGMFDHDHDARIWISDDGRRLPVQIRSSYPVIGAVTLRLSRYVPGR